MRQPDPFRWILLLALLCGLVAACSTNDSPTDGASWTDGIDGPAPGLDGRADLDSGSDLPGEAGRTPACLAQDTKLQAALDGARKSPNALLVVRNTACGTSVYASGASSTGGPSSLWRVGSVTKTYVAATILSLVRDKKLGLDDALSTWVAGVPNTAGVTVKMLLNHTSGIFNVTEDPTLWKDPLKVQTPAAIVALATSHAPYFAPGAGWHYSNTNYTLLGMIAEKAGGAKAGALLRKHALQPAGLDQTFLEGEEPLKGALAAGFDQKKNNVTLKYSMSVPWTAGAMVASGADLCDWIHALLGSTKVLTAAEQKTMLQTIKAGATMSYGLGVMVLDPSITAGWGQAQGHGGDIFGYHTQAFWFPDKKTAICAVVNQDGVSANPLTLAAIKALF